MSRQEFGWVDGATGRLSFTDLTAEVALLMALSDPHPASGGGERVKS